jgi:hypothetical protein
MGQKIGIFISSSIFMNLNSVNFCNTYLGYFFKETLTEPLLTLENYIFTIGVVFYVATAVVTIIPEGIDESRVDKSLFETYSILNDMRSNKYLLKLAMVCLLSKVGQIFFNSIAHLVLIQKGISEQTLTNISTILMPVEMAASYYTANFKSDFLGKYLSYFKYLAILYFFELIFLVGFDYWYSFGGHTSIVITIIIIDMIKSIYASLAYISIQGFFHLISDKGVGVTYITAIYTINNLSYKWPGIFIYTSIDWFGYEVVGLASLLYCAFYYNFFYNKMTGLEKEDASVWLVQHSKAKSE